jgi:hypothetical protein
MALPFDESKPTSIEAMFRFTLPQDLSSRYRPPAVAIAYSVHQNGWGHKADLGAETM